METPNEFWLSLHELARAVSAEGRTDEERFQNILASLSEMPAIARGDVLAELVELLTFLPDLYPHVVNSSGKMQPTARERRTVA